MWHLMTWFSGGGGNAGLMVRFHELRDFFSNLGHSMVHYITVRTG